MSITEAKTARRSIAILGDSIPRGVVLHPEKKRYVFLQQGFIKNLTQKLAANIFDFSKFGSTTRHGQDLISTKLTEIEPDIVLIEYGGNDCDFNWDEVAARPEDTHLPNISITAYERNLRDMVEKVRQAGKTPVLVNLPPLNAQDYFNWFSKGDEGRKKSILKWLLRTDNIYWWHEQYSYVVDKIAMTEGCHRINIRKSFMEKSDYKSYICGDGIHPNEKGQALIEQAFLRYIEKHAAHILG